MILGSHSRYELTGEPVFRSLAGFFVDLLLREHPDQDLAAADGDIVRDLGASLWLQLTQSCRLRYTTLAPRHTHGNSYTLAAHAHLRHLDKRWSEAG